ncbi:hypothetical protein X975_17339, partial [Stegodyphus mimosarum]
MLTHTESHSDVRILYTCSLCTRNYTRRDSLQRHLVTSHLIDEKLNVDYESHHTP